MEGKFLVGSVTLIFMLGYFLRPETVTSDRSGYWISVAANNCVALADCVKLGFPSGVFGLIRLMFPFHPSTTGQWDAILAILGWLVVAALALWVSKKPNLMLSDSILFWAMCALSSMYIFMLSKDVIQVFIFLFAYQIIYYDSNQKRALAFLAALFLFEGVIWRPYYCIVSLFFIAVYIFLKKYRCKKHSKVNYALGLFATLFISLFAFSVIVKVLSPSSYAEIVDQHGVAREEYTAIVATSGIKSIIPVSSSSPVPLFVVNWFINIIRLMFPFELFLKGPYYWIFAVYQIYISYRAIKTTYSGNSSWKMSMILSLYFAFVIASGSFEPDFGSWVRHETAAFPFLISVTLNYINRGINE